MHSGEPYGHMTVKGDAALAKLVGMTPKTTRKFLKELEKNGVISSEKTEKNGEISLNIYSPRMVRDYEKHLKRQADGGKGGNPALGQVVNHEVKPSDTRDQRPETRKEEVRVPRPKRTRTRTQIDPNWTPSEKDREYARKKGIREEEIEALGGSFVDYNLSLGRVMADWPATWRTWINREINFNRRNNSNGFRGSRIQDDSLSTSRAAAELAGKARRGEFSFGPRPGLAPRPSGNDVRLLPKG
jgi:hypothetical protein